MPLTLTAIAGAAPRPARPGEATLVIIDAQEEYVSGRLPLAGAEAAVAATARLLAFARKSGMPVVHVVHEGAPGRGVFARGSAAAAILPTLVPRPGEAVVVKTLPNSFAGTDLAARLEAHGRGAIVLAGFMTHMCVSTTARAALDHGYRTTVVAEATATRDLPDPLDPVGVIPAATLQRTALAEIADRFATVLATVDEFAGAASGARAA